MTDNEINNAINNLTEKAHEIVDERLKEVSNEARNELVSYAKASPNPLAKLRGKTNPRRRKRTGELAKNIKLTKLKNHRDGEAYQIDGGERSNYTDHKYHAIVFFKFEPAQIKLSAVMKSIRKNLNLKA